MRPGDVIGNYRIDRLLGEGGMAQVYLATHVELRSRHAFKILLPEYASREDVRERFLREGRIQSQLVNDHIARVTDFINLPEQSALVVEYLEGPTLEEHVEAAGGPLPRGQIVEIMRPVLQALTFAHGRGVIHRDLKPSNIVLARRPDGSPRPVIVDFGIAKLEKDSGVQDTAHHPTAVGARMGAPHYMSPEQIRGAGDVDQRTDIFALGAILYEMATGWVAFEGRSEFDVYRNIVEGIYEPPERRVEWLDPVLGECIRLALSPDPAHRFPDCESLLTALETGQGLPSVPPAAPAKRATVIEPVRPTDGRPPSPSWTAPPAPPTSVAHPPTPGPLPAVGAAAAPPPVGAVAAPPPPMMVPAPPDPPPDPSKMLIAGLIGCGGVVLLVLLVVVAGRACGGGGAGDDGGATRPSRSSSSSSSSSSSTVRCSCNDGEINEHADRLFWQNNPSYRGREISAGDTGASEAWNYLHYCFAPVDCCFFDQHPELNPDTFKITDDRPDLKDEWKEIDREVGHGCAWDAARASASAR